MSNSRKGLNMVNSDLRLKDLKPNTKFKFVDDGNTYTFIKYKIEDYDYTYGHDSHYDYVNFSAYVKIFVKETDTPLEIRVENNNDRWRGTTKKEIKEAIAEVIPDVYVGRCVLNSKENINKKIELLDMLIDDIEMDCYTALDTKELIQMIREKQEELKRGTK